MAFAYPLDKDGDKRKRSKRLVFDNKLEVEWCNFGCHGVISARIFKEIPSKYVGKRVRLIAEIIK